MSAQHPGAGTNTPPIRVLLVDDHAIMRAGFRMILQASGVQVVGEAATGTEAIAAASALQPDVICMDVQMPDMDGLEATRRIVADRDITAAVLVVTTFDRDDYLFAALAAGASGFLLKNAGPEDLVSAVRVVAGGDALLAPEVTRRVIERFSAQPPAVVEGGVGAPRSVAAPAAAPAASATSPAASPAAPAASPTGNHAGNHAAGCAPELSEPLTEREGEVLALLAQALSNAEIAEQLFIGEATVKTHVSKVLQKLGARDRVQAVVFAHRSGLA
ncbi:MAG TPA: response regulator transcription factor [Microbacteriaceae bacterium]|jgi:DNA-binding NarL/FixJ family response regulator|nr:response regulator transcription factor [Microbacteriaceae bacterium]